MVIMFRNVFHRVVIGGSSKMAFGVLRNKWIRRVLKYLYLITECKRPDCKEASVKYRFVIGDFKTLLLLLVGFKKQVIKMCLGFEESDQNIEYDLKLIDFIL
jgi:hypothetical protein